MKNETIESAIFRAFKEELEINEIDISYAKKLFTKKETISSPMYPGLKLNNTIYFYSYKLHKHLYKLKYLEKRNEIELTFEFVNKSKIKNKELLNISNSFNLL